MDKYFTEQILPLLGLLLLLVVGGKVVWRWRVLHGDQAPATVYQLLGKQGSGSSGVYEMRVRYEHPQRGLVTALVQTSHSQHDAMNVGMPIDISYISTAPFEALPTAETSVTWQYGIALLVSLMLMAPLLNTSRQQ
ncbi:hypothetical protein [Hymenobacter sp. GOD-10R]|uniref:hypothetical protein n=1 Tax=Hymenobacter sp. GOD-10R TaxID=3093922 RepID=UPI002D784233|nr:hypothetical protein [Hymenobacter sp. GOD-10R]WRQ27994.1 hypothetical protein SD425_23250 [Hymenobacter sp. GOD-10R]